MSELLAQITNLTIGYHTRQGHILPVARNVSLQIGIGEALGLVGESGCGKSTLCMALLAHLRSGSRVLGGKVLFDNTNIFQLDSKAIERLRGQRIAYVPQNAGQALTPTMYIGTQATETLILHHGLNSKEARRRVVDMFYQLHLPQPERLMQRYPHQLSGGQQQRVVIAMALARQPDLLILDEPTTSLDVTNQAYVLHLLQLITREYHTTVFYVSHDLDVIAQVSDRVAVMYAGELVEIAPVDRLFANPAHPYTLGLLSSRPRVSQTKLPPLIPNHPPASNADMYACAFAPRCTLASQKCYEQLPQFTSVETLASPTHYVRCHHWHTPKTIDTTGNRTNLTDFNSQEYIPTPFLKLQNVSITYTGPSWLQRMRSIPVEPDTVHNVSLVVYRGETLALVGESGSGKTTLLRAIMGLMKPHSGHITFAESDLTIPVDRRSYEMCRIIQYIFQNPDASLNPRQTVAQMLEQPLRLYFDLDSIQRRERVCQLLEQVQLVPHYLERFPSQLSGGEKQRVAIARAFAAEPELVLCDEVTSALDVSIQSAILNVLKKLQKQQQVTYLFVTHNLAIVRVIADRMAVLYHGRLCEVNLVAHLQMPPWHPYTETLINADVTFQPTRPLHLLAHDVPDPIPPIRGCPFQRRCPRHIGSICDEQIPPWQIARQGQHIHCHITPDNLRQFQVIEFDTKTARI